MAEDRDEGTRGAAWLATAVLVSAWLVVQWTTWQPGMPAASFDDLSWPATLAQAAFEGRPFGSGLIYTGGPWSLLYTGQHHPALAWLPTWYSGAVALAMATALLCLWQDRSAPALLLLGLAATLPLSPFSDYRLLALPLLALLLWLRGGRGATLLCIALLVLAAFAAWAKFSVFIAALLILLPAEFLLLLRERRWPLLTPAFLLACVGAHLLAGQPLSALPDFLRQSFALAAGYGDAISRNGPHTWTPLWSSLERCGFLLLALATLLPALSAARRRPLPVQIQAQAALCGLAALLFLYWKAGFVRHDAHALYAWAGLLLANVVLLGMVWQRRGARRLHGALALAACLAYWTSSTHQPDFMASNQAERLWEQLRSRPVDAWRVVSGELDAATLDRRFADAMAAIRQQPTLPMLEGSLDVVTWPDVIALANGLAYRPRPLPGYLAGTPGLRRLAPAFFASPARPDWVLWARQDYDDHFPGVDEANILPALLAGYDATDVVAPFLLLRARQDWRPIKYLPLASLPLVPQAWIDLPADAGPLWAEVKLPRTLFGALQGLAWRRPRIYLQVEDEHAHRQLFNLPLPFAESGFLLSPVPNGMAELLALADWIEGAPLRTPAVRRLRLLTDQTGAGHAYDWPATLVLSHFSIQGTAEAKATDRRLTASLQGALLASYEVGSTPFPPSLGAENRLMAHPPSGLALEAGTLAALVGEDWWRRRIVLGFGIQDAAWQDASGASGVCFALTGRHAGQETTLWQRCLDPAGVATDRGEQQAGVTLPGTPFDQLLWQTDPKGDPFRDWAYWSQIRFE